MEELIDAGLGYDLPELDPEEYMVGLMLELGPTRSAGVESGPTDWPVIAPFGSAMGLDADDMLMLAKMCAAYHAELSGGENPLTIAPMERG